ncbi:hypothetical protein [Chryseobacterium sp.]|uniref:hypothetical protein n=1 Tax=Chryseobacterium sp. TaxID=1871047 RepID=UPI0011CAD07F|nr:hypothetical protein [Chryseobacterium sp.]TXF79218.1 hypothetical protein FUA25_02150 [Chryseobacterium sp.]
MKYSFSIIFYFFSLAIVGQNKSMVYNKNQSDFKFTANEELKKEFNENENSNSKIQVIAKITNDTVISIYLKNNTEDSLNLSKQDRHLYLIQEAKNKKGEWKPIEYWSNSWCGNSYLSENVESQKIIKTETEKYNGTFETEIRFKFLIYDEVVYSNQLKGKINVTQFEIPKEFREHSTYKNVLRFSDRELAEKVMFLEPNAMKEFSEKYKKWVNMIADKNKKRIETENKKDQ